MPIQKLGIACPKTAKAFTRESKGVPWALAAQTPRGIAITTDSTIETAQSSSEAGILSSTMGSAGALYLWEMPGP